MIDKIILFSIRNKLIVILFTITVLSFGLYSILNIPVGATPDITNNQVQVITTSSNLSTQEIEQYITAPVEMEMSNLPGVQEIRSISKFGISLVTVVLDEKLGTYLPRQLINEKIKLASVNIPEGYGTPEMGPITTGLGEIYQYTLEILPGYEDKFSAQELRTIQDWTIKRRLSGIDGVVEINSWGAFLKQYEVAIIPNQLNALNISILDVFDALESNNAISGAAYIEKMNQSYFIRGDGAIRTIDDIENIVIKSNNGSPILIKNVANVNFGSANRYGAITANGKGETVLGQVMMLKNANSKLVINQVKERILEIQKTLPKGIVINPIVDRSDLISKTTSTVAENLIIGALIVMITVFLIIGNLRSAFVIASIIPLSLCFTLSMMYIFGVDANLMSLGALDFGIIIDGAVIIVEFIMLHLTKNKDKFYNSKGEEISKILDETSIFGSSKMMKSAIFGQIIILIIFIPILTLSGVEGKMFKPMAFAFCSAIIGAMIMGFTWLPVASSLFLKPNKNKLNKVTQWIINFAYNSYKPSINWAFKHKKTVFAVSVISLIFTFTIFSRMGGEFVPTLDEGDFVIQPVIKTGTSLNKTIDICTNMEKILIKNFPNEVEQIVSRIGAAEVPTDPMSMEEVDMIVKLKNKKDWKSTKSKAQLEDLFKEALSVIPGIEFEFTQPIEMRFNELITGVRSDIAIKIFGDNLDYINSKANEIKKIIENIPGAGDVVIEKTTGLPQIKVKYDFQKMAYYGVSVKLLNDILQSAFGGKSTGVVFEGEKRFDLVVRYDSTSRVDINNIENLLLNLDNGVQIPFSELAEITYSLGPAKISRENAHRLVVISVNVRNRDLKSLVVDIQNAINNKIKLNPDTYISYGGQFENLENATSRLLIAVPVALILIFIFLHFAFRSIKYAIMVFSAIPLSTVGGVLLLWVRGMPFSISAGIGFIALFGIAVLNGIVLIEHLKELKVSNYPSLTELIKEGATDRLRPVMLTAGAAAMGFLPMAISTGAGAEVQRPLATVVIGGLVSSGLLTMIVLPLIYDYLYNVKIIKLFPLKISRVNKIAIIITLFFSVNNLFAQNKERLIKMNLDQMINYSIANNEKLNSLNKKYESIKIENRENYLFNKTNFSYGYDQTNIAENLYPLHSIGLSQSFLLPGYYKAGNIAGEYKVQLAQLDYNLEKNNLIREISFQYFQYLNNVKKSTLYFEIDSLYKIILQNAEKRLKLGDTDNLELLNIKAKKHLSQVNLSTNKINITIAYDKLKSLININEDFNIDIIELDINENYVYNDSNSFVLFLENQNRYSQSLINIEKYKNYPEFSINYNLFSNTQANNKFYSSIEIGIDIPLFNTGQKALVEATQFAFESQKLLSEFEVKQYKTKFREIKNEIIKYKELIDYYNNSGKNLKDELIRTSTKLYKIGSIDFTEFVQTFETALKIEENYINDLINYMQFCSELEYLNK